MAILAKDLINLAGLEAAMDAQGLDAVVARTGMNFTYLAGFAYPGTFARHRRSRGLAARRLSRLASQGRGTHRRQRDRRGSAGA